jgi:hypothetical protein
MQFHVNLWHSRSEELAGKLAESELPADTQLKVIEVNAFATGASGSEGLTEPAT